MEFEGFGVHQPAAGNRSGQGGEPALELVRAGCKLSAVREYLFQACRPGQDQQARDGKKHQGRLSTIPVLMARL